MKKTFLFNLFVVSGLFLIAQDRFSVNDSLIDNIVFEDVIQVDNKSASELYISASGWIAKTYSSNKDVIQVENADAGILIAKGFTRISVFTGIVTSEMDMFYTIDIQCRNNRYKLSISNIYYLGTVAGSKIIYAEDYINETNLYNRRGNTKQYNQNLKKETINVVNLIFLSLETEMKSVEDEW